MEPIYVIASPVTRPWLGMLIVSFTTEMEEAASITRRMVPWWNGSYGLNVPVFREYEILSSTLPPEVIEAAEKLTLLFERVFVR